MTTLHRIQMLLTGCVLVAAGCGQGADSGPDRFHATGTVRFDGQALQRGTIQFLPAEGNSGPEGFATITDGQYDTKLEGSAGHVGGKMVIKIKAEGPVSQNDEPTKPPFDIWGTEVDLPKSDSEQNFDVPKDAADPKPVKRTAPVV
jgi:hypothetical protein